MPSRSLNKYLGAVSNGKASSIRCAVQSRAVPNTNGGVSMNSPATGRQVGRKLRAKSQRSLFAWAKENRSWAYLTFAKLVIQASSNGVPERAWPPTADTAACRADSFKELMARTCNLIPMALQELTNPSGWNLDSL